jgi:GNAT superfamily N-acetyltransferase
MPATRLPEVEAQVRLILQASPLYVAADKVLCYPEEVRAYQTPFNRYNIQWGELPRCHELSNHFDIEIDPVESTGYLLSIAIREELRGQGLGWQLYQLVEQVIRLFGCRKYEMTPSGTTVRGESRETWLARRGFTLQNGIAFKLLEY